VRKAYRTALFVGLVILAVPALAIAWIPMWIWYRTTQLDTFYRERPVLGAMRTRQSSSSNNSAAAREALLENLPLGTNKALVITDLSQIGFGCQAMTAGSAGAKLRKYRSADSTPAGTPDTKPGVVDCQLMVPAVLGHEHWIVDLEFDGRGQLINAVVARCNIFL